MTAKIKEGDSIYWYYNSWYMLFAHAVRFITGGAAHVAKVVEVRDDAVDVEEARMIGGVVRHTIPKIKLRSTENKKIVIMSAPFRLTSTKKQKAIGFCLSLSEKRKTYGYLNMLREWRVVDSIFRAFGIKKNSEFFCSSLGHAINMVCGYYTPVGDGYPSPAELMVIERLNGFVKYDINESGGMVKNEQ